MRSMTVTQIKRKLKGKPICLLQNEPREGSRMRELYDLLFANIGKSTDLDLDKYDYTCIKNLGLWYGLDIRMVMCSQSTITGHRRHLHTLAGEWFGQIYVDYLADTPEQVELMLQARVALQEMAVGKTVPLPEGVHRLSKESIDILQRLAERGRKITEKHRKKEQSNG